MPVGIVKRGRGRPRQNATAEISPAKSSITSYGVIGKNAAGLNGKLGTKKAAVLNAAALAVLAEKPYSGKRLKQSTTPPVVSTTFGTNAAANGATVALPKNQVPLAVVLPCNKATVSKKRKAEEEYIPVESDDKENSATQRVTPPSSPSKSVASWGTRSSKRVRFDERLAPCSTATSTYTTPPRTSPSAKDLAESASSRSTTCEKVSDKLAGLKLLSPTRSKADGHTTVRKSAGISDEPRQSDNENDADEFTINIGAIDDIDVASAAAQLPSELSDTVSLFSAFLKTLVLHAGYSRAETVECKPLLADVSRVWGRRQVDVIDLRVLLGVYAHGLRAVAAQKSSLNTTPPLPLPQLGLADHGRSKTVIEIIGDGSIAALLASAEARAALLFTRTMCVLWQARRRRYVDAHAFWSSLPRAHVVKKATGSSRRSNSAPGSSPAAKQPLLVEAFKLSVEKKKAEAARIAAAVSLSAAAAKAESEDRTSEVKNVGATCQQQNVQEQQHTASSATAATKTTVLDRIRAKQSLLAQLASSPAEQPETKARRRALGQCGAIASVLDMLCQSSSSGGVRASFPLSVVKERLKDSLGMGLASDEAERGLRVLAEAVAPEWVQVMRMSGGREFVVCMRASRIARAEIERRAAAAAAALTAT